MCKEKLFCSFSLFQQLECERKVAGWLSPQQESGAINLEGKDETMQLLKKWTLDHVQASTKHVLAANRFTVSQSGAIGTSCYEKASLAVMYPDTNEPPIILAEDDVYRSATFVEVGRIEYLAAAFNQDGCLYLWDVKSETSKKVFDPKLPSELPDKYMMIFEIDENTTGYGEVLSSSDGSRRVFILKMDSAEEWSLTGTLRFFTPHDIWDICYLKVADGTPCLLLCIPHDRRIMAVEMVGGKTRWETAKEQMGKNFYPWGICTDEESNIILWPTSVRTGFSCFRPQMAHCSNILILEAVVSTIYSPQNFMINISMWSIRFGTTST